MSNAYIENGYKNRQDYLEQLAEEYDAPLDIVMEAADLLGPSEDFDGLVMTMEDYTFLHERCLI